ncbi:iron chaperone [Nocardia sp. NPDC052566]|uniref:iron chaperone n=1 Tax=Nocardia sp. NPDC052566 TaxID=3364330 RepID=UPI0037CB909A
MTETDKSARGATATSGVDNETSDKEAAVLATIARMAGPDRAIAARIHAIVKASVPALAPRLWYGIPGYAINGKVVCFFQEAESETRYATFGFTDAANLDDGAMWPVTFALTELTAADEERIGALVKRACAEFTAAERTAIAEHVEGLKMAARRGFPQAQAPGEADVLEKIAAMAESDRAIAERIHAVVAATLSPKLWYGMPAYAKDDTVVCFFQSAERFKMRYATLGFNDCANLDDGTFWPTGFALTTVTDHDEANISELMQRAIG